MRLKDFEASLIVMGFENLNPSDDDYTNNFEMCTIYIRDDIMVLIDDEDYNFKVAKLGPNIGIYDTSAKSPFSLHTLNNLIEARIK
jgi:hypothetical protein